MIDPHLIPDQDDRHEDAVQEGICPTQAVSHGAQPAAVAAHTPQVNLYSGPGKGVGLP